jgi:hypothetical protein
MGEACDHLAALSKVGGAWGGASGLPRTGLGAASLFTKEGLLTTTLY